MEWQNVITEMNETNTTCCHSERKLKNDLEKGRVKQ
jgi:hypothetical protein